MKTFLKPKALFVVSVMTLTIFVSCEKENVNTPEIQQDTVVETAQAKVDPISTRLIALKANNGKYVSSENGNGPSRANRNAIGAWEKIEMIEFPGRSTVFKGNNGKYLTVGDGSSLTFSATTITNAESFFVIRDFNAADEVISIRNNENGGTFFISSENGRKPMTTNRPVIGAWEKFEVVSQ